MRKNGYKILDVSKRTNERNLLDNVAKNMNNAANAQILATTHEHPRHLDLEVLGRTTTHLIVERRECVFDELVGELELCFATVVWPAEKTKENFEYQVTNKAVAVVQYSNQ